MPALQVLDAHLVICKDEFVPSVDADDFQSRLCQMSHYGYGDRLSAEQIDRIRYHLFPELRITPKQLELLNLSSAKAPEPETASANLMPIRHFHLALFQRLRTRTPQMPPQATQ